MQTMATKKAYIAGGCFWGMEDLLRKRDGVVDTEVGYMGGENKNPTYDFHPGHAEAVEVEYDEDKISFIQILDLFFRVHNPTTKNQQGNDIGSSYRSAVFYQTEEEKMEAQKIIDIINTSGDWPDTVQTTLEPFDIFYPAEPYHQDYLLKNPLGYTCHFMRRKESYL